MLDADDAPLPCRKLGRRLGVSQDTAWRWCMLVLALLKTVAPRMHSVSPNPTIRHRMKAARAPGNRCATSKKSRNRDLFPNFCESAVIDLSRDFSSIRDQSPPQIEDGQ